MENTTTKNYVKNDSFVTIQGWMINKLGLKNNELTIYAIIYGFSQDGESEFNGSLSYLCDWCSCTKQGALKCLKSLVDKKYIIKSEVFKSNTKFCTYKANLDMLTEFNTIKQSLIAGKQSLIGPIKQSLIAGKQSLPNNITNNIDINNINNTINQTARDFSKRNNTKNNGKNDRNFCNYYDIKAETTDVNYSETF